ncbi:hypothetical protein C8F01DRAFT_355696 [Mycena amicta]|nr:hypothetical protein C8F01DRAFT_355696 [Mycena amicta]
MYTMDHCILPLEICDLIIQLDPAIDTLVACSLVCKSWLPSARACRFRTLLLSKPGSPKRAYTLLANAPHLRPFIRKLDLRCERSSWISWEDEYAYIVSLLAKLHNIEHVEFTDVDLVWQPDPVRMALIALLRASATKRLVFRRGNLPAAFFELFGAGLRTVELLDVSIDTETSFGLAATHARPRRVVIEGSNIGDAVDCLGEELEDVQSLCVRYFPHDHLFVERLLRSANNLKSLEVGLLSKNLDHETMLQLANVEYDRVRRDLSLNLSSAEAADEDRLACLRALERLLENLSLDGVQSLAVDINVNSKTKTRSKAKSKKQGQGQMA